ncbi:hypothetical protein BUALT_Bualt12G0039500 [Buddleja alternifolia]|uniref:F-box domain-containing protein n=1 Tax=Buddleja alternifolia TaxID=168488 RepID=A0AAV6WN87_9LAMI|nr:hypothetical protein BUALT_Bualt12G0039500 [Buddleja alternifolia]
MSYEEKSLPHDVIIEILSWLPPETLLKFKRVCRSWCSIITTRDAKFVAIHQSHFGNSLQDMNCGRIVIAREKYKRAFLYLKLRLVQERNPRRIVHMNMELRIPNTRYFRDHYRIIGSCNGVFCYASFRVDNAPIQLCNPSMRWAYLVPPYRFGNNLKFPFINACYGVGFDRFVNDYKVLKFVSKDGEAAAAAIYSMKTKSWKRLTNDSVQLPKSLWCLPLSVFLGGFIHWLGYKAKTWTRTIMLFHVCNEVFGEMQLPAAVLESRHDNIYHISISVVKGSLCLLVEELTDDHKGIWQVWTMKEYGVAESWIKQRKVVLGERIMMTTIQLTVGGKILCSNYKSQKLFLYDPETDKYQYVGLGSSFSCSLVASL